MKINEKKWRKEYTAPQAEYLNFKLSDVMTASIEDVIVSDVFDDEYDPNEV